MRSSSHTGLAKSADTSRSRICFRVICYTAVILGCLFFVGPVALPESSTAEAFSLRGIGGRGFVVPRGIHRGPVIRNNRVGPRNSRKKGDQGEQTAKGDQPTQLKTEPSSSSASAAGTGAGGTSGGGGTGVGTGSSVPPNFSR
jgi:hypothetical protein